MATLRQIVDKQTVADGVMGNVYQLLAGGPGSGCQGPNCGRHGGGKGTDKTHVPKKATLGTLREQVISGKFKGGWKRGGRDEGEGYRGHFKSFYDHSKHGLLEIRHSGPFRENPVQVRHNGTVVSNSGHDATRKFLRDHYGIRYGSRDSQGF